MAPRKNINDKIENLPKQKKTEKVKKKTEKKPSNNSLQLKVPTIVKVKVSAIPKTGSVQEPSGEEIPEMIMAKKLAYNIMPQNNIVRKSNRVVKRKVDPSERSCSGKGEKIKNKSVIKPGNELKVKQKRVCIPKNKPPKAERLINDENQSKTDAMNTLVKKTSTRKPKAMAKNNDKGEVTSEKVTKKCKLKINKNTKLDNSSVTVNRKRKTPQNKGDTKNVKRPKKAKAKPSVSSGNTTEIPMDEVAKMIEKKLVDEQSSSSGRPLITYRKKKIMNSAKKRVERRGPKKKSLLSHSSKTSSYRSSVSSGVMSWTKDISSSSTTTCVTVSSDDFFCIDGKLPVVPLIDMKSSNSKRRNTKWRPKQARKIFRLSETDTDSNTRRSRLPVKFNDFTLSYRTTENSSSVTESPSRILNLSVSTSPSRQASRTETVTETAIENTDFSSHMDIPKNKLVENYLQNIKPHYDRESLERNVNNVKLKRIDLDFVKWLGAKDSKLLDVNENFRSCCNVLKQEAAIIDECRAIKKELSNFLNKSVGVVTPETDSKSSSDTNTTSNTCDNVNSGSKESVTETHTEKTYVTPSEVSKEQKKPDTNAIYDDDDDDALSLFAESIGGLDSSRMTISDKNTPKHPNNIHQSQSNYPKFPMKKPDNPIQINKPKVISTISDTNVAKSVDAKSKIVCEKQNADSTSINKEDKVNLGINHELLRSKLETLNKSVSNVKQPVTKIRPIELMITKYTPKPVHRTSIFTGVCFFNISVTCKNNFCNFNHKELDCQTVQSRLQQLDNFNFIQEYMLMRRYLKLRQKYMSLFIENCMKRNLPRILLEMAIDCVLKETSISHVAHLEAVLLGFNNINFSTCKDMLLYRFSNEFLCDILLHTIAYSQNFTRFISVFVKLVKVMTDFQRHVDITVATQTLERVCILPYNESLTRALLSVILHTDYVIFSHFLISKFEELLLKVNSEVYEEFISTKKAVMSPTQSSGMSDQQQSEPQILVNNSIQNAKDNKRYTSPDTTLLDTLNKSSEDLPTGITPLMKIDTAIKPTPFMMKKSFHNNLSRPNAQEKHTYRYQTPMYRPGGSREGFSWSPRPTFSRPYQNSPNNYPITRPMFNPHYKHYSTAQYKNKNK